VPLGDDATAGGVGDVAWVGGAALSRAISARNAALAASRSASSVFSNATSSRGCGRLAAASGADGGGGVVERRISTRVAAVPINMPAAKGITNLWIAVFISSLLRFAA